MRSLSRTIAELERWYDIFNRELFGSSLSSHVVITVQSTGRRRSILGWHWTSRWKNRKANLAEINLVAESLRRPPPDILETLLHEMCHHACAEKGIRDTSNQGIYHNKYFKNMAEKAGLTCQPAGHHGWALTALGARAREVLRRFSPDPVGFSIVRLADPEGGKKPSRWKKWICECGGIRVSRSSFKAVCLECHQEFEPEEQD